MSSQNQTQRHEGHPSTRSLPHHHVTPQSDRYGDKKQPPEQRVTRLLQIFDQLKPHILWVVVVTIAIYDYFHLSDLFGFIVLIGVAAGSVPLSLAIELLRGRSVLLNSSLEKRNVSGQPRDEDEDEDDPD